MKNVLSQSFWIDYIKSKPTKVTLLAGISVLGLLMVQIYFVRIELQLNKQKFEQQMDGFLLEIHHSIEEDYPFSEKLIALFKEYQTFGGIKNKKLKEEVMATVRYKIDSVLLSSSFAKLEYGFLFYTTENNAVVMGNEDALILEDYFRYSERAGARVREALVKGRYRFGIHFPYEHWFLLSNMWFVLLASVLLIGMLGFLFWGSITALKKQKQLAQLKNEFINNLTHELKTPIFASSLIHKIAERNLRKGNLEALATQLDILKSENKQLKGKVEKVLQLSVLEHGKLEMDRRQTDIHEVIRESVSLFSPIVENLNGELSLSLNAEQTNLLVDRVHIVNVVNNLLDNAIKYCKAAPKIKVSTSVKENDFQLFVQDFGKGIKPEEMDMIFEKFYRSSQGDLHDVKGFGLGLSYVKMIVDLHGGNVDVKSAKAEGTLFCISLPLENNPKKVIYAQSQNTLNGR